MNIFIHFEEVFHLNLFSFDCFEFCSNNKIQVNDETWQQIENLHEPLKVVAETMVKIQAENFTLSDAYGQWITLREDLKSIECTLQMCTGTGGFGLRSYHPHQLDFHQ